MNIFEEKIEFRLPGFPQAMDQGNRGTCVSFSTIALLEYYLDFKEKLSQQFLYACCHLNEETEGSDLKDAFEAVKRFGVCKYSDWPYNKNAGREESQLADKEMLKQIPVIKFDDVDFQLLKTDPPRGIDEYKSVLSGADGSRPSPVVVGCQVFSSSGRTPGWMTLPASPLESPMGQHAMLIYGWKDTPGMESRGYFYVQNSWGSNNAIKLPFEYIERYAIRAGRFIAAADLSREIPEINTDSQTSGTKKMNSSDTTRSEDLTFDLPADVTACKDNFFSSQKENLQNGKYPYPGINLPFPYNIGAYWNVNTACFNQPENIRNPLGFAKFLQRNGIHHLFSEVKIFRIQIKKTFYYHLISAFLYRTDGKQVDANDLELLNRYYKEEYWAVCRSKPGYTIFTIGTSGRFSEECQASCNPVRFLCEPGELPGIWLFKLPQAESGIITQEFFTHILPGQYTAVIKEKIDHWYSAGMINMKSIKKALGACDGRDLLDYHLNTSLDDIFASGKYAKTKDGNIAPPSWGPLPKGYKKAKRYAKATHRQIISVILWLIATVLLIATALVKIPAPVSIIICVITAIVDYKRNQVLQRFRFGKNP